MSIAAIISAPMSRGWRSPGRSLWTLTDAAATLSSVAAIFSALPPTVFQARYVRVFGRTITQDIIVREETR